MKCVILIMRNETFASKLLADHVVELHHSLDSPGAFPSPLPAISINPPAQLTQKMSVAKLMVAETSVVTQSMRLLTKDQKTIDLHGSRVLLLKIIVPTKAPKIQKNPGKPTAKMTSSQQLWLWERLGLTSGQLDLAIFLKESSTRPYPRGVCRASLTPTLNQAARS